MKYFVTIEGREFPVTVEGDRVTVPFVSGCGTCEWCERGEENLCAQAQPTCLPGPARGACCEGRAARAAGGGGRARASLPRGGARGT